LAGIIFLLLVPTTIILAENASINLTGSLITNISRGNLTLVNTTANLTFNTTPNITASPEENKTDTKENATRLNITIPVARLTLPEENATNQTLPEINDTVNVIPPINQTRPDNESIQEPPEEEPGLGPVLEIRLDIPERANRNEPFQISAEIRNTGDQEATDVEVEWVLPGLSVIEGSGNQYCQIPSGAACTSQLLVAAPLSSILGENEIKVLVRYAD
jgi:hypothetical protein